MRVYTDRLIQLFLDEKRRDIASFYAENPDRKPRDYASNAEAIAAVMRNGEKKKLEILARDNKKKLDIASAAEVLVETVALVAVPNDATSDLTLAVYNYDRRMYEYGTGLLNTYIVELLGASSDATIRSMMMTLVGKNRFLPLYNPLPEYKIAVRNGIYNCLTEELEPFTPETTVLSRINTDFIPGAVAPEYEDGFTFDRMIRDFANNDENRVRLMHQILKSIVTGRNVAHGFFVFLGNGGDGKSTMFDAVINMIGRSNVGFVNFSEINNPEKMLETLNKKLVVGMDNDVNTYIKKTSTLKSMASHETITYTRKYLPAVSEPFRAPFIQLCNAMPRFAETGSSMKRRLITFKAENSYYEKGTQNKNVERYIQDPRFHEYMLRYILQLPYFSDYNDVDREVTRQTLEGEDTMTQFFEELVITGVLSKVNRRVPVHYIYAIYRDWLSKYNDSSAMMGLKGFTNKMTEHIRDAGYTFSEAKARMRPSAIEKAGDFVRETLGPWQNTSFVQKAIEDNVQFRYLEYDETLVRKRQDIRRNDHEVSAVTYFGLEPLFNDYMNRHQISQTEHVKEHVAETVIEVTVEEAEDEMDILSMERPNEVERVIKAVNEGLPDYVMDGLTLQIEQMATRYGLSDIIGILTSDTLDRSDILITLGLIRDFLTERKKE